MGKERIFIVGKRFGRLTVLSYSHSIGYTKYYLCKCDCGNEKTISKCSLTSGKSKSCGCLHREIVKSTLGRPRLPNGYVRLGRIYNGMKKRCYDERSNRYSRYGARGIGICSEWLSDKNAFRLWAINNGYRPGLSIDRINNDEDYCPENCRWIDPRDQLSNYSKNVFIEFNGKRQTLAQWSRELNMPTSTLHNRIRVHGWSVERALTEPRRPTNR